MLVPAGRGMTNGVRESLRIRESRVKKNVVSQLNILFVRGLRLTVRVFKDVASLKAKRTEMRAESLNSSDS